LLFTVGTSYTPTSGENNFISYRVEGGDIADLSFGTASAQTVTLSFYVRSSLTGTFGGSLRNGGSNRSYPFSYTINTANTFEYKTITIPGDTGGTWLTTNGVGFEISWGLSVGSTFSGTAGAWVGSNIISVTGATNVTSTASATWFITGVQLEVGSVATPFERRPFGTELALCQRYYEWGVASGSGYAQITSIFDAGSVSNIDFKVSKRAVPTLTNMSLSANVYPNNQGNSVPRYENGFSRSFRFTTEHNTAFWNATTGGGGSTGVAGHQIIWNAAAEL
jgi:hypothetical protein